MGSFDEWKKAAERWLGESSSTFKLLSAEQNENRFVFGVPDDQNSFNVICPTEDQPWVVCSEQESMLIQLQDVMEYIDSHSQDNLTIDMVLTRINQSITNLATGSQSSSKNLTEEENDDDVDAEDDEDEEDDMNYYDDDDLDAQADQGEKAESDIPSQSETFLVSKTCNAPVSTVHRLYSDLRSLNKTGGAYGFVAEPIQNNLFLWKVKLTDLPEDTKLGKDLKKYAELTKHEAVITMEMKFPNDYPFNPPFLRVVRPYFKFLTGHVTIGGSVCMQMLTKSGWMPTNDIEGILVQVRTEILSDPNASLDFSRFNQCYSESDAKAAFSRMVERYGWDK